MSKPRIVEAVATASGRSDQKGKLSKVVEAAMAQAVLDALAAGITDPIKTRKRMLLAREEVMAVV